MSYQRMYLNGHWLRLYRGSKFKIGSDGREMRLWFWEVGIWRWTFTFGRWSA